jgi:hypothetical protein
MSEDEREYRMDDAADEEDVESQEAGVAQTTIEESKDNRGSFYFAASAAAAAARAFASPENAEIDEFAVEAQSSPSRVIGEEVDVVESEDSFIDMATQMLTFDPSESADLTLENIVDLTHFLFGAWCHDGYDLARLHERNLAFFGDRTQLLDRFRLFSSIVVSLDKRVSVLTEATVVHNPVLLKECTDQLALISANILYGYDAIVQTYRQFFCNQPELLACLPPLRMDVFFAPMVESDMKTHQKLIRYLLEQCSRRSCRRQDSGLFAPKFTEDGHFTRTFTFACEIVEFIYDAIYPYQQHTWLFTALTEKAGIAKMCCEYLTNCRENDLPVLVKDRTKFSFRNGLYDAKTDHFYPYGVEPEGWLPGTMCANYIDVVFDYTVYDAAYEANGDPMDIPTPHTQKILTSQEFPREVCRWFYASMGRMIYEIGSMDGWQFFPFCKGTAGSGKSTLLRLTAKFYNDVDVGNLMSEGQKTFSIEDIYNKYVFFCYDVDDKMNFSLTRWNQMVSGESIAIERKFKLAVQQLWTVNGAFAGNSYPPWVDQRQYNSHRTQSS